MSQGNDLSNYAPSAADAGAPDDDVWFVAVASDDIRQMSVDQLDEALNAGLINAETAVWQEGMEAWSTLGEVAGLDEDEAEDDNETTVAGTDYAAADVGAAAAGHQAPESAAAFQEFQDPYASVATPQAQPSSAGHASLAPNGASMAPGQSSLAPVAGPAGAFGQSTVPVALNVDEEMPPIRTGRRFRPERWVLAAVGLGAVGVTLYNNDVFTSSASGGAAEAAEAAPQAFAARPYEPGGVDKGAELSTTKSAGAEKAAASDEAAEAAPIGSAVEDDSADDEAEAKAAPPKKSLRSGKLSRTYKKAKPRKTTARRKASRASAKKPAAKKSTSTKVKRAASAFDPLNGALP